MDDGGWGRRGRERRGERTDGRTDGRIEVVVVVVDEENVRFRERWKNKKTYLTRNDVSVERERARARASGAEMHLECVHPQKRA